MSKKETFIEEYDRKKNLYQRFSADVEYLLKRILSDEGISYNAITNRLKDRDSLSKKIDLKGEKYSTLSEITDIAGIRVITYYADDVERIANIVEREFEIDRENSIDKGKALEPDRFGYCSVHYVVKMHNKRLELQEYKGYKGLKCEIQIRSVLQHAWAEIEHDLGYKSTITIPRDVRRNFSRLAGLLEIADKEFQEIRQILKSYKVEVEENITEESFTNTEIDAVLLETIVDTNNDITYINSEIAACFKSTIDSDKVPPEQWETTIKKLKYLDIHTLGQLQELISANKHKAIGIAKAFAAQSEDDGGPTYFRYTIAFFYLCYAEILNQSNGADAIVRYLKENNIIGRRDSLEAIADRLLKIKEQGYK